VRERERRGGDLKLKRGKPERKGERAGNRKGGNGSDDLDRPILSRSLSARSVLACSALTPLNGNTAFSLSFLGFFSSFGAVGVFFFKMIDTNSSLSRGRSCILM
jgi:hypothetical protein